MSETAERANDCSNDQVVTKLRTCGDIVNAALQLAASMCVEGAKIATVCDAADALITEKCGAIYNKPKGIDKGIAFPTCVSVNQIVCHYSPLSSVDGAPLKAGDVVKIDCGAQVDGHASLGAHTVVVAGGAEKLTGDAANCVAAAYTAAALAARMLKVGNTNAQVTAMFAQVAADFGVSTVAGVLSHKMEQHRLDTTTSIIGQEDQDTHVEEYEFEANDVFAVDCVFTTGDGKPKEEADARTTVYKRVPDAKYLLKLKAARAVYSDVSERFQFFPFAVRALPKLGEAKLGLKECEDHGLIVPYPVLKDEKDGSSVAKVVVAQVKFTALLLPGGTVKVTGLPFDIAADINADKKLVDEELVKLAATSFGNKKKKKNKKKKTDAAAAAE